MAVVVLLLDFSGSLSHVIGSQPLLLRSYAVVVVPCYVLAAMLLIWRAGILRSSRAALLAAAYTFAAPLLIENVVTVPGILAPHGLIGTQVPAWCWLVWHSGWALLIALYAFLPDVETRWSGAVVGGALAAALVAAFVCAHADAWLPVALLQPGDRNSPALYAVGSMALALMLASATRLAARREVRLDTWMFVATAVLAVDVLFTMTAASRFSVGSYIARSLGALNALIVIAGINGDFLVLVREQRNTELQRRLDRLRWVADGIPQLIWISDELGHVEWFNARWHEYTGTSIEASHPWATSLHPDDVAGVSGAWQRALAESAPFECECRLRARDGSYRWFLARSSPIRSSATRIARWYGTCTDIDDQKMRYEREHRIAQTLQQVLLPHQLPSVLGLSFVAAHRGAPPEFGLSGDWYDVFALPDGRVVATIGDVVGHGLEATASMVRAREAVRAAALTGTSSAENILALADDAFGDDDELIATAVVALIDPRSGVVRIASAGHPTPIFVHEGRPMLLPLEGILLGVGQDERRREVQLHLQAGDRIVFYTDGLIESDRHPIDGESRLIAELALGTYEPGLLTERVLAGGQEDDVTVLVLNYSGPERCDWHFRTDEAEAAHAARHAFTRYLLHEGMEAESVHWAELVFGELVGNVVRHAPGPIEIDLSMTEDAALLCVRDRGPGIAPRVAALPNDVWTEGGRGLYLVGQVAGIPVIAHRPGGGAEVKVRIPRVGVADPAPTG